MPTHLLASLTVIATGALWGLYWMPLRQLEMAGVAGPWATLVVVAVAALLFTPFAVIHRRRLRAESRGALLHLALGGASFALYSHGLLYGKVAVVILLFYLTPVWSTLIGRFWLGWAISPPRYIAIGIGLAGMALVLAGPRGLPLPSDAGDWLGLASGILWSVASTGIRRHSTTGPAETNFVFVLGAVAISVVLVPLLSRPPTAGIELAAASGWIAAMAMVWWGASLAVLLWATQRLEPARVGILLMTEVIVGVASAGVLAGEPFGWTVGVGGLMVIAAAFIETWPARRPAAES